MEAQATTLGPTIRMMNGGDWKEEQPVEVSLAFSRLEAMATKSEVLALTLAILRQLRDHQRNLGYIEGYEDVIAIWPTRWIEAMPWLRRNTLIARLERLSEMGLIDMWLNEHSNKRFVRIRDAVVRAKGEWY